MTLPIDIEPGDQWTAEAQNHLDAVVNSLDASKLLSIGDQGWISGGTGLGAASTSTIGTSELLFTVGVTSTGISALWTHWYTTSWIDTDPAGPISFNASLRVVSSTNPGTTINTIHRLTFGGRTTATLDPGAQITADILGITLAAGDEVAIRTCLSSGTAWVPRITWGGLTGALGGFTATSDLTAPGSAAVTTSFGNYYGPAALLGYAQGAASAKSVLLVGDSIGASTGDNSMYTNPALGNGGFVMRAIEGVAGLFNIAIPGDNADLFQDSDRSSRRWSLARFCTSAIIEYGILNLAESESAATVEGDNLAIATNLRRTGITKVFVTTLLPATDSTDGWITTANQTVLSIESNRVMYNTWVRAGCPIDPTTKSAVAVGTSGALLAGQYGHPFTGFFDTASTVETSLNSGIWLPPVRTATGSMTSGSSVLTSSTANFLTAIQENGGDVGLEVVLVGAGAGGTSPNNQINSVSNSTTANLAFTAATTATNATLAIGLVTADGRHPMGRGHHLMSQAIDTALL